MLNYGRYKLNNSHWQDDGLSVKFIPIVPGVLKDVPFMSAGSEGFSQRIRDKL